MLNAKANHSRLAAVLTASLLLICLFAVSSRTAPALAQDPAGPRPQESHLVEAQPFTGDLRDLPQLKPVKRERPEREEPNVKPVPYGTTRPAPAGPSFPGGPQGQRQAPAPSP